MGTRLHFPDQRFPAQALLCYVRIFALSFFILAAFAGSRKRLHSCKQLRQSQIVQSAIDSSGTVVTQVLIPAQFTPGLYFFATTDTDMILAVRVSCVHIYSRSKNNLQLLFVATAFKFYSGVLRWFSF